jgi:hypothetical protein
MIHYPFATAFATVKVLANAPFAGHDQPFASQWLAERTQPGL